MGSCGGKSKGDEPKKPMNDQTAQLKTAKAAVPATVPATAPPTTQSKKHVLIIDSGSVYGFSKGEYNHTLTKAARDFFVDANYEVEVTYIEKGYVVEEEIEKYMRADYVIYQTPCWWYGVPFLMKKYMDEVFTAGGGKFFKDDGRTRSDPSKKYGSGGLLVDKKYMFSLTFHSPDIFSDPNEFYDGVGIDHLFLSFHNAQRFIGMTGLPTFSCTNVLKGPQVEKDVERYREHLREVFVNSASL